MKKICYPNPEIWTTLSRRPVDSADARESTVLSILDQVSVEGDRALKKFTQEFDGVSIDACKVEDGLIRAAQSKLSADLVEAIRIAKKNITRFHPPSQNDPIIEVLPGVRCWSQYLPIETIGLYIPGGSAPLFSTVLMLAIPAQAAGCKRVILCSPPGKNGEIHPAILFTALECGISEIFRIGGAQAIAAMACGTQSIPKVDKIFGPGNSYVTVAKQLVSRRGVAIDLPAGPSEVLVIADQWSNPRLIAADLLSQAEHDADSQVVLVSDSEDIIAKVEKELALQLEDLPRRQIAQKALQNSFAVLLRDLDEAMQFANVYAPEHLILAVENLTKLSTQVRNAGSVFLGTWAAEVFGDYASGTNHVLPTSGYARAISGVSVQSFLKRVTFQELDQEGIRTLGSAVVTMARAEGLEAHARAAQYRIEELKP